LIIASIFRPPQSRQIKLCFSLIGQIPAGPMRNNTKELNIGEGFWPLDDKSVN
jgi:hypothetical protein